MDTNARALAADLLDIALSGETDDMKMGLKMFELVSQADAGTLVAVRTAALHVLSAAEAMTITNSMSDGSETSASVARQLADLFGSDGDGIGITVIQI
jgi:hypothetical protein